MVNPITTIRHELGLSRQKLCHAAGIRMDALYLAEAGLINRPQNRMLAFLEQLDYDPDKVVCEYKDYRDSLRREVIAELAARIR